MKWKTWSIAILSAVLLTLSACSNSGTENADTGNGKETVELRFAWWGSEDRHTATLEAIKIFEEKNPGIKILPEYSGFDGYESKLQAQVAGNSAPDLFQSTGDINNRLGVDAMLPLDGVLDKKGMNETTMESVAMDGKTVGAYIGLAADAYLYDKTLLDSLGVEPPKPPYTWDDLAAKFKEVSEKSGGKVYGAVDSSVAFDVFKIFGVTALDAPEPFPNDTKSYTFTEDQIKAYYQYWADLRAANAVAPPDLSATSDDSANSLIVKGKAAFVPIASSSFSRFQSQTKNTLDMVMMPQSASTGRTVLPGTSQVLSISATTKHPEEAAKFLNFFVHDTDAAKVLKTTRGVLPTEEQQEALLSTADLSEGDKKNIDLIQAINKLEGVAISFPPSGPQILNWKGSIEKVGQEIAFGKISVDEGAKKLMNEVNAVFGGK
ncbi:ABC transporter substrate-binding protein [Paenibacillus macerans]|uniref:ABC transporter substrate-binding protein n=1 Tax=Paenibacillus macerans TaxID=44252 RepID=UPI00203BCDEF|nr:ABC transporter substrate-binding protein [Paenibacillus macerans]MCM3700823.1 ABC transporter substrate-binding protein [Paenibacillus macerans]